jgi:hypothetical protein
MTQVQTRIGGHLKRLAIQVTAQSRPGREAFVAPGMRWFDDGR